MNRIFLYSDLGRPLDAVVIVAQDEAAARYKLLDSYPSLRPWNVDTVTEIDASDTEVTYHVFSEGCGPSDL